MKTAVDPRPEKPQPRGIVIRPGTDRSPAEPFWAYMWTNDDETAETHWHQLVPAAKEP